MDPQPGLGAFYKFKRILAQGYTVILDFSTKSPKFYEVLLFIGPAAQCPWRPTVGSSQLTEGRSNVIRSVGADQSLKSARSCPSKRVHLI